MTHTSETSVSLLLSVILEIQELDMQMLQLMSLKKERRKELDAVRTVREELQNQSKTRENALLTAKKEVRQLEGELADIVEKAKQLEIRQSSIKKIEEFNALTHEMAQIERERAAKEQRLSDSYDRVAAEEDALKAVNENLDATAQGSRALVEEVCQAIADINQEGRSLQGQRDRLALKADSHMLAVYDRLLRNKKDRVVVPIENRCCSGCHITVTVQDENLVRRGERVVFCEHCSRIHYWVETQEADMGTAKRGRKRRALAGS